MLQDFKQKKTPAKVAGVSILIKDYKS